jgi:SAM-dependent methyltransferase
MSTVDWSGYADADVLSFADTVGKVARSLARIVPAARGAPLFGLDMTIADPELLDRFSRHGIFRKYQRAVALGAGLGGVQRWWSVHFGCSVLSVDPHAGLIAAAERLAVRTKLAERVTFRAGPLHNLPLRAEQFTHAWSVEGLVDHPDPDAVLREALRVLRPAGLLSVVLRGSSSEDDEIARWTSAVAAVGFIAIVVKRLALPELPLHRVLRRARAARCLDRGVQRRAARAPAQFGRRARASAVEPCAAHAAVRRTSLVALALPA